MSITMVVVLHAQDKKNVGLPNAAMAALQVAVDDAAKQYNLPTPWRFKVTSSQRGKAPVEVYCVVIDPLVPVFKETKDRGYADFAVQWKGTKWDAYVGDREGFANINCTNYKDAGMK